MPNRALDKLGFGAWQIGGSRLEDGTNKGWSDIAREEAVAIVRCAYDSGIRFFDTSNSYGSGRSEEILGEALSDRDDVVICTKYGLRSAESGSFHDFSADNLHRSLSQSLERLGRKSVDFFLMHNPKPEHITGEVHAAFGQAKSDGLIRYSGLSVPFIEPFVSHAAAFDAFELLYNPITRQNLAFLDALREKQVFFRSVFASGLLLKPPAFFSTRERPDDWRKNMPEVVYEKAEEFVQANPDMGNRYDIILDDAIAAGADQVIIGISRSSQLDMLNRYLNK